MSAVIALCILLLVAWAFAVLFSENIENTLAFSSCLIILYLYFFYCAGLLVFGIVLFYLLVAVLLVYAYRRSKKNGISISKGFTPAILCFCVASLFAYAFTKENTSVLWDELRVWAAMPRAIYETKQLQLGNDALIFDSLDYNMQTYPPALPLFSYYFMALAPEFSENYTFFAYAVFVYSVLVPLFRKLTWKQVYFVIPTILFYIHIPRLFTSHGGDFSYFYESLFIDPVLGFAAGYTFYLSINRPGKSFYSCLHFATTLAVLTIVKDSGALFAVMALINAGVSYYIEEKHSLKSTVSRWGFISIFAFTPLLIWKTLLSHNQIVNHLQVHLVLPKVEQWKRLISAFISVPVVKIGNLSASFATCIVLMIIINLITTYRIGRKGGMHRIICIVQGLSALITVLGFAIGYRLIFIENMDSLPSYQRYFSTVCYYLLFILVFRHIPWILEIRLKEYRRLCVSVSVLITLGLMAWSVGSLKEWETKYDEYPFCLQAKNEAERIRNTIPISSKQENVYLLMGEMEPNILHHRIYFDLIGSGIKIKNFCVDTDMHYGYGEYPESVEVISERWYERLKSDKYDYIYVFSTNENIQLAFEHLNLGNPIAGNAYRVD